MTSGLFSFHNVLLLWAGLVIGLAMILIVIAMVSVDEHCTPAQRLRRLGIARRATLGCCSRTSDPERHQGMGLLVFLRRQAHLRKTAGFASLIGDVLPWSPGPLHE
jgi:hypothetical protein